MLHKHISLRSNISFILVFTFRLQDIHHVPLISHDMSIILLLLSMPIATKLKCGRSQVIVTITSVCTKSLPLLTINDTQSLLYHAQIHHT